MYMHAPVLYNYEIYPVFKWCILIFHADGTTKLIEVVAASPSFDKSSKLTNDKGETPLHLAAKPHLKKDVSATVLSCLVQLDIIDPSTKAKNGKTARDYIPIKDNRYKVLETAGLSFKSERKQKKKKKKPAPVNDKKKSPDVKPKCPTPSTPLPEKKAPEPKVTPKRNEDMPLTDKIAFHLSRIYKMDIDYFQEASNEVNLLRTPVQSPTKAINLRKKNQLSPISPAVSHDGSTSSSMKSPSIYKGLLDIGEPVPVTSKPGEFGLEGLNFDTLPWEVEVTRNVIKFFKNTKKYSPTDRISAARVIYSIAEGKRNTHLSKAVGSNQKVSLYEARINDASRILWEKAINFSEKLSKSVPMYTQVIRVWEVIIDHDDLDRRIKYCAEQIIQCYDRGYLSSVRWGLKLISQLSFKGNESVRGQEQLDVPFLYTKDQDLMKPEHHFVPAASTNESEYSVTTFYSFDTVSVKSMITGSNEKRDYPFKEWQRENEVIKITSKEAILLLGRSGTGKTTCCLYRLWNEFKNYWNPESLSFGAKIPRKALVSLTSLGSYDDEDASSDSESSLLDNEDPFEDTDAIPSSERRPHSSVSSTGLLMDSDLIMGFVEEDLHQVFVTKNYVLCDQMKKRFFCMMAGCDFLEPHLDFEEEMLPNSLLKCKNLSFPVFLTARQFYILLDNSLEDDEEFFRRDINGDLQVKISSLDYDHEDSDILLDLEQSDSEDEDVETMSAPLDLQAAPRQHSVKWTEVTSLYFKEVIWPKISHGCGKEFDPMLVWLEIQSFIKGSELAVDKGAPLSFVEYTKVGNKMAPNFSNHRDVIYKLYLKYHSFLRNSRHHNYLFDECDLVLNLHQRLKKIKDVSWSIHSVYIDEVQDFTQAELAIFISCCRDPNSMFFTGDTAQSIMRGIAFRFEDLRSSFHRMNTKVPCIHVPQEPLKLTINYRSHSGILKLAGSVIDLISEFFKDSIDHLPDDEGMFPGPEPVFLDSCEEKDLSLLLSTNKRECSAIEFGAHQVILVQSKEAKDNLPDILKGAIALTIFEAKGLEFDDVLLYNFFTDSLVSSVLYIIILLPPSSQ